MSNSNTSEALLTNIESLQKREQILFHRLETEQNNLTEAQKNEIISEINEIVQNRISLYQSIGSINHLYTVGLSNASQALKDQATAVIVVEQGLNEAKLKMKYLEQEKLNKLRLIEINTYYGEKYKEHATIMKIIVITLLIIFLFSFLYSRGLIWTNLYYILVILVGGIGGILLVNALISALNRDNMNYQEYNWYFNPKNAPLPASGTKTLLDPWKSESNAVCMGQACCYQGSVWDSTVNVCVPTNNMQKIEEGFTKYSKIYKKPDVILDEKSIQPFYKELN
jgi:hypothetical protein